MKSILTAAQMRATDQHTIETVPIAAIDLMENASLAFTEVFTSLLLNKYTPILICCGTGNNGGDGLAVARLLQSRGYDSLSVWVARFSDKESSDFATNFSRLHHTPIPITEFFPGDEFPPISQEVVIDALLGSGLNKPVQGDWLRLVRHINRSQKQVIAIDIPTGLQADGIMADNTETTYATDVISFQRPKISFFFPESAKAMNRFHVATIGLDEAFIEKMPTDFKLVEEHDIRQIYQARKPFTHKGTYGHALIIAGSETKMGAALLCCGASLYSGSGLTTACIPDTGLAALNTRYPEVMYCSDSEVSRLWDAIDAVGFGPGLGDRAGQLPTILTYAPKPLVLDADALNVIAAHPKLLKKLPEGCLLTPHMKEFDRLFGAHRNWWERLQTAKKMATRHQFTIILKNQYTFIVSPDEVTLINPTGSPAMASGGAGDVLTGMLTSFLAQQYSLKEAAMLACYIHGASGDQLANKGMAVVPPGKLIEQIPYILGRLTG